MMNMKKLLVIIFSYNRAMQLETLLHSMKQNLNVQGSEYQVAVLYNYSNVSYGKGYEKLFDMYPDCKIYKEDNIKPDKISLKEWFNIHNLSQLVKHKYLRHPKTNFRSLLIDIMQKSEANHVMFLTDDSVFIRDIEISNNTLNWIEEDAEHRQFSLRIGQGMNNQPDNTICNDGMIEWNFYDYLPDNNWGYPFSVDGHIYSRQAVLLFFRKYVFTNPSTLESVICSRVIGHKFFGYARCNLTSSLLSFPLNMVQEVADNEKLNFSPEVMNKYFLEGYRLDYPIPQKYDTFQQYPDSVNIICGNERMEIATS